MGYLKGKSAIPIARTYGGRPQNFVGAHFWARGYFVATVGRDEEAVRRYIREQEAEDRRLAQLELFKKKKYAPAWRAPGLSVTATLGGS